MPGEFFLALAKQEVDELLSISNDYDLLIKKYKARMDLRDSRCVVQDDILWRMLCVGVPLNEPTMMHKVNGFINSELKVFKEKVS